MDLPSLIELQQATQLLLEDTKDQYVQLEVSVIILICYTTQALH